MNSGFLGPAPETDQSRRLYDEDLTEMGFVMNVSRVWAHRPDLVDGLFALMRTAPAELRAAVGFGRAVAEPGEG